MGIGDEELGAVDNEGRQLNSLENLVQFVGSRVLAPYFGSTIFVWGSLIGIILAALS
jgi:hypothetical protein